MMAKETLSVRAVRTEQGDGTPIFAFFIHGADITRISDKIEGRVNVVQTVRKDKFHAPPLARSRSRCIRCSVSLEMCWDVD